MKRFYTHLGIIVVKNIPNQPTLDAAEDKPTTPLHEKIAHIIIDLETRTTDRIATMPPEFAVLQLRMLEDYNHKYQQAVLDYISTADDADAAHAIDDQGNVSDAYMRTAALQKNHQLDILIGADLYGSLLLPDIRKRPPGSPVAQRTTLGWIIS